MSGPVSSQASMAANAEDEIAKPGVRVEEPVREDLSVESKTLKSTVDSEDGSSGSKARVFGVNEIKLLREESHRAGKDEAYLVKRIADALMGYDALKICYDSDLASLLQKELAARQDWQRLCEISLISCGLGAEGARVLAERLPTTLTSLNLSLNDIGDEGARVLAERLPAGLTSLNLWGNSIGAEGTRALAERLPTGLTSLNLCKNDIGPDGARALADQLPAGLTSLFLSQNGIGDEGARALAERLPAGLKRLGLLQCGIGPEGARALAERLPAGQTYLDISLNAIGAEGARALVERLPAGTGTHWSLNMLWNNIGAEGQAMVKRLLSGQTVLNDAGEFGVDFFSGKELEQEGTGRGKKNDYLLHSYRAEEKEVRAKGQAAPTSTEPDAGESRVNFTGSSGNELEQEGADTKSLHKRHQWTTLSIAKDVIPSPQIGGILPGDGVQILRGDDIDRLCKAGDKMDNVAIALAASHVLDIFFRLDLVELLTGVLATREAWPKLCELRMVNCEMGEAVRELAKWLPAGLTSLHLGRNLIGDEGVRALAAHLPPGLTSLHVEENEIGDEGMRDLAAHLPLGLTSLNLAGNKMGDEGVRELAANLPPGLTSLDLTGNSIGSEWHEHGFPSIEKQAAWALNLHGKKFLWKEVEGPLRRKLTTEESKLVLVEHFDVARQHAQVGGFRGGSGVIAVVILQKLAGALCERAQKEDSTGLRLCYAEAEVLLRVAFRDHIGRLHTEADIDALVDGLLGMIGVWSASGPSTHKEDVERMKYVDVDSAVPTCLLALAEVLLLRGKLDESQGAMHEAVKVVRKGLFPPPQTAHVVRAVLVLAECLYLQKRVGELKSLQQKIAKEEAFASVSETVTEMECAVAEMEGAVTQMEDAKGRDVEMTGVEQVAADKAEEYVMEAVKQQGRGHQILVLAKPGMKEDSTPCLVVLFSNAGKMAQVFGVGLRCCALVITHAKAPRLETTMEVTPDPGTWLSAWAKALDGKGDFSPFILGDGASESSKPQRTHGKSGFNPVLAQLKSWPEDLFSALDQSTPTTEAVELPDPRPWLGSEDTPDTTHARSFFAPEGQAMPPPPVKSPKPPSQSTPPPAPPPPEPTAELCHQVPSSKSTLPPVPPPPEPTADPSHQMPPSKYILPPLPPPPEPTAGSSHQVPPSKSILPPVAPPPEPKTDPCHQVPPSKVILPPVPPPPEPTADPCHQVPPSKFILPPVSPPPEPTADPCHQVPPSQSIPLPATTPVELTADPCHEVLLRYRKMSPWKPFLCSLEAIGFLPEVRIKLFRMDKKPHIQVEVDVGFDHLMQEGPSKVELYNKSAKFVLAPDEEVFRARVHCGEQHNPTRKIVMQHAEIASERNYTAEGTMGKSILSVKAGLQKKTEERSSTEIPVNVLGGMTEWGAQRFGQVRCSCARVDDDKLNKKLQESFRLVGNGRFEVDHSAAEGKETAECDLRITRRVTAVKVTKAKFVPYRKREEICDHSQEWKDVISIYPEPALTQSSLKVKSEKARSVSKI